MITVESFNGASMELVAMCGTHNQDIETLLMSETLAAIRRVDAMFKDDDDEMEDADIGVWGEYCEIRVKVESGKVVAIVALKARLGSLLDHFEEALCESAQESLRTKLQDVTGTRCASRSE